MFDRVADEDYKMTEAEVINYVRQVCEGLKHMHENNIVHLDIKVSIFYSLSLSPYISLSLSLSLCVCECVCVWCVRERERETERERGGRWDSASVIFVSVIPAISFVC